MPTVAWGGLTHGGGLHRTPDRELCAAAGTAANPNRTLYVCSNVPYMKALIIVVLPVPWSPRNTTLCFVSGAACGSLQARKAAGGLS